MRRRHVPTEFGFATGPYIPPEQPRPAWRTIVIGALLALIPIVGPGVSAVYVDRRDAPDSYAFPDALKTALIQLVAVALLALIAWVVLGLLFGISIQVNPRLNRAGG
ncbi:MAG: hypothetical protein IT338_18305 [Thermomicrobiales bacterium]|nr:hypothetical protein [Thermomicrobiales bacterium]